MEASAPETPLPLSGEWFFLPGVRPNMPANPGGILVPVPMDWSGYETADGQPQPGIGSGTFYLDVFGLPDGELGVFIKDQGTAYALYFQERTQGELAEPQLILSNGAVGETSATHRPEYQPQRGTITVSSGEGRFILTVSNFSNRTGGMWNPILLGSDRAIRRYTNRQSILAGFSLGVILFLALNYSFYYSRRRRELASLLLALFSLTLAIRHITVERLYSWFLPSDPATWVFEWLAKAEIISTFLLVPLFFFLVYANYPNEMRKGPGYVLAIASAIGSLVTLFTPHRINSVIILYFQVFTVLAGVYALYVLIAASVHQRSGARVALAGFGVFFVTIINDVLNAFELVQTPFLAPYGFLAFLLAQSFQMSVRYAAAIESVQGLNRSLFRFVPQEFIKNLGKESILDVQLGDAIQREMTILFSDIRSFTSLSEQMSPQENFLFLNSYLRRVGPVIRSDGGYIDKYLGDGIMALFPEKPADAVRSALRLMDVLTEYNQHRATSGYAPITIGVGIHSGRIILGTVGETERIDGTVIADAVNVASRLEGMNKVFGTSILISEEARAAAEKEMRFPNRLLGLVAVRGKKQPMRVYEIFPERSFQEETMAEFEHAVELYFNKDYSGAHSAFEAVLQKTPQDGPARYYSSRCERQLSI